MSGCSIVSTGTAYHGADNASFETQIAELGGQFEDHWDLVNGKNFNASLSYKSMVFFPEEIGRFKGKIVIDNCQLSKQGGTEMTKEEWFCKDCSHAARIRNKPVCCNWSLGHVLKKPREACLGFELLKLVESSN